MKIYFAGYEGSYKKVFMDSFMKKVKVDNTIIPNVLVSFYNCGSKLDKKLENTNTLIRGLEKRNVSK